MLLESHDAFKAHQDGWEQRSTNVHRQIANTVFVELPILIWIEAPFLNSYPLKCKHSFGLSGPCQGIIQSLLSLEVARFLPLNHHIGIDALVQVVLILLLWFGLFLGVLETFGWKTPALILGNCMDWGQIHATLLLVQSCVTHLMIYIKILI